MAYTKKVARHDRIEIDGTDYSNAFNAFGFTSADTQVDASGFSVTGVDENLPGPRAQGFTGTMFVTSETLNGVFPLHNTRAIVQVYWQPDGLVTAGAPAFWADCYILEFSPADTRGDVSTTTFNAVTATEDGIQTGAGT